MECLAEHKLKAIEEAEIEASKLYSCKYEIFGKLHHVGFRDHTTKVAENLKLRGFVMYTSRHTIIGEIQGHLVDMKQMRFWLEYKGSPLSRIDKATFSELKQIEKFSFRKFSVKYEF